MLVEYKHLEGHKGKVPKCHNALGCEISLHLTSFDLREDAPGNQWVI